jgi:hypothetical protein
VPVKGAFTPGITFLVFTCAGDSGSDSAPHPIVKTKKPIASNNPHSLNPILIPISILHLHVYSDDRRAI